MAVNYKGRPFMLASTENKPMGWSLLAVCIGVFVCAFEVFPWFNDLLKLVPLPSDEFRNRVSIVTCIQTCVYVCACVFVCAFEVFIWFNDLLKLVLLPSDEFRSRVSLLTVCVCVNTDVIIGVYVFLCACLRSLFGSMTC